MGPDSRGSGFIGVAAAVALIAISATGCVSSVSGAAGENATVAWTKYSDMRLPPDLEPGSPWAVDGVYEDYVTYGGSLHMRTGGAQSGFVTHRENRFDSEVGSTAEIRMKLLEGPGADHDAAFFSLQDGAREGKVSFFDDRIEVRDGNILKATYGMNTTGDFHTYRVAIAKRNFEVFVDGQKIAAVLLIKHVPNKAVVFGDGSVDYGENFDAYIDYIAYTVDGAFAPSGDAVSRISEPTAPVVDVAPDMPQRTDDLVSTITNDSLDTDGDAVSYSFAWFKDDVLQPQLTTNTVDSALTDWGETWRCIVTPNDGLLDGTPAQDEVTIDAGFWTKFSGMFLPPDAEPESPWIMAGSPETRTTSGGILTLQTSGNDSRLFSHPDDRLDNALGSTAEIKMKLLSGPDSDYDAAFFSLQDGAREGKVSFFNDRIEMRDGNMLEATHALDATDDFHTYRLAIAKRNLEVFVDGQKIASIILHGHVSNKAIAFGDGSIAPGENFSAQVDYVAYTTRGAFAPWDQAVSPASEPTAPVIDVIPDSPQKDEDLVSTITIESTDTDGDAVSYSFAWFKDDVLQPQLTTNTVVSSLTNWGETWKCIVTPSDGVLDGLPAQDQVTIDTGTWTKFSGMNVPPDAEPASPWLLTGAFETSSASGGILTLTTTGNSSGLLVHPDVDLDNTLGSTAEVKLKLIAGPDADHDAAFFSLQDGSREGKVSFFDNRIEIRDGNTLKTTYAMDTTADFHAYRLVIASNSLQVFVDGKEIASIVLNARVSNRTIMFGDGSMDPGENLDLQVDYIAYSTEGAPTSPGQPTTLGGPAAPAPAPAPAPTPTPTPLPTPAPAPVEPPGQPPTSPVIEVTPDSPQKDEDLVSTVTAESTDPDGDAVSYSFAWFKDDVLQPQLTTNTVVSSLTNWGETWKCIVTPSDGVLDGLPAQDQVTIDTGFWTIFSGMNVPPDAEPASPWLLTGAFETSSASGGILTLTTTGNSSGLLVHPNVDLDNALGSTAEIRMKVLEGPGADHDAAFLSLQDGAREGKVSFFDDRIEVRDGNTLKATHALDATGDFHTYRMAIAKRNLEVFVDGQKVNSAILDNHVPNRTVMFGDGSTAPGENFSVQVDYLAFSVEGALAPSGEAVTPISEPTTPVVDVTPDSPRKDEDLVCTITTESTDPDGDAVSYSFAWYKDGALQPQSTTNTVDSALTDWAETWKCIVTPSDGILDGSPAQDEVTIDTGTWTKFSGMNVPPDAEPASPWLLTGAFETRTASGGILTLRTTGNNSGLLVHPDVDLDNTLGSTVEIRMKLLAGPGTDHDAAFLSLQDGSREGKVSFFNDRIEVRDSNTPKVIYTIDTTDAYHTYRLAMVHNNLKVFVDDVKIFSVVLRNQVANKAILFGDGSIDPGENFNIQIDYIAYSTEGALAP